MPPVTRNLFAPLLVAATTVAVLYNGGFSPASRIAFGALALLALTAALAHDRTAALRALRHPVVIVLFVLAILGALSAAWTTGSPAAALRWSLVTFGYGALVVTSWVACQHQGGRRALSLLIAALALVCGLIGIYGAASFVQPIANHTTGFWRPAGTLGYSSALSLLEVSALPAILLGMVHPNRGIAAVAGLAGAVAAVTLSLGQARLECTMAALICAAAVAIPRRTVRSTRAQATAAVTLLLLVAVLAYIVAGLKVSYDAHPHQLARLLGLASICVSAAAVWSLARARRRARGTRIALIAAICAVEAAVVTITAIKGDTSHVVYVLNGGFFHGRLGIWSAAIGTAVSRILAGHGADYSLISTPVPLPGDAIADAYDLPLEMFVELGVLGLGLTLALYGAVLRAAWLARAGRWFWLFAPAAICFLLSDVFDWEWHLAGSGAVWALALGALIAETGPIRITRRTRAGDHREAPELATYRSAA